MSIDKRHVLGPLLLALGLTWLFLGCAHDPHAAYNIMIGQQAIRPPAPAVVAPTYICRNYGQIVCEPQD